MRAQVKAKLQSIAWHRASPTAPDMMLAVLTAIEQANELKSVHAGNVDELDEHLRYAYFGRAYRAGAPSYRVKRSIAMGEAKALADAEAEAAAEAAVNEAVEAAAALASAASGGNRRTGRARQRNSQLEDPTGSDRISFSFFKKCF